MNGVFRVGSVAAKVYYERIGFRNAGGAMSYVSSTLGFRCEWCI